MARTLQIEFSVSGACRQTIHFDEDLDMTDEQIIEGLNDGSILTTVQEGGHLLCMKDDANFGTIADCTPDMEYFDFEDRNKVRDQVARMSREYNDED